MKLLSVLFLAAVPLSPPPNESSSAPKASPSPAAAAKARAPAGYCAGEYANDFAALSKRAVDVNLKPETQFTYCVRVTATYECLSYGNDGNVRRAKKTVTAHGTAFAYGRQAKDTLLVTNSHVTEFPPVSDEEHPVDGVPTGCKKVGDTLKLVENEKDGFEVDDIPLSRVVNDPALDVAVIRAKAPGLSVMPWRIGKSSALRERNVVDVRGFPLGAFKATSLGKVISTYDKDDYKDWDHDDFVVDALLSPGNSGSPVLAVSCATGEYELVGIFHADYSRGSALNVVIHIDEVRALMTTLKRSSASRADASPLDRSARARLMADVSDMGGLYFPFGALTALLRTRADGAILFQVFARDFPRDGWPALTLEDLPDDDADDTFGTLGRTWYGNARGLKEVTRSEMDAEVRAQLEKNLDALRRTALLSASHQRAMASSSRESADLRTKLERKLKKAANADRDGAQGLLDLAEKEAPKANEASLVHSRPNQVDSATSTPTAEP